MLFVDVMRLVFLLSVCTVVARSRRDALLFVVVVGQEELKALQAYMRRKAHEV